jgi:hypothetical protein
MNKNTKENDVIWDFPSEAFTKIGQHFEWSLHNIGGAVLLKHIMGLNKGNLSEMSETGKIKINHEDPEGKRYLQMIEQRGGRLIYKHIGDVYNAYLLTTNHGLVSFYVNGSALSISTISTNEVFVRELRETFCKEFLPAVQQGHIFAIVRSGNSLKLSSLGNAAVPLVRGNYTPQVMEDYQYVIKDLNTSNPSGRISIMEGEPGTGKTHLIRAMLMEVPDAMFVLLSPEIVPSLAGPELLPLLLAQKHNYGLQGPIVLVLEDADRCLVTRSTDNLNSIQSLLNLGDGILGSLLDLRIVATTNAKKLEMETAILRPGRLSKRLEVGALDFETARGVFRRLLPNIKFPEVLSLEFSRPVPFRITLAEVYFQARQAGWEPEVRENITCSSDSCPDYDD